MQTFLNYSYIWNGWRGRQSKRGTEWSGYLLWMLHFEGWVGKGMQSVCWSIYLLLWFF